MPNLKSYRALLLLALLPWVACSTRRAPSVEEQVAALGEVDFNFHVKPLLAQNCYECHGPESEHEAGLRVDSLAALIDGQRSSSNAVGRSRRCIG